MKKHKRLKAVFRIFLGLVIIVLLGFISPLRLKTYDLTFSDLPEDLEGYKILQISDFHCKDFGTQEQSLIRLIEKAEPDLIVMTGDIVDEDHTTDNAEYLLAGICDVAPIYYITGNHEYYSGAPYDEFKGICAEYGVTILTNEMEEFEVGDETVRISGLDWINATANMRDKLGYANNKYFNILIYHDSSKFNYISDFGYDVVFCGHGHGGLIRIPFVGGLIGTDYRLFPEYDYGLFYEKSSIMVSSSGLGDARVPRWNNPRECVLVTLHGE